MDEEPEVLLERVLRPSPPLAPRALLIVLALVAAVNLGFAATLALQGAWPVAPFLGADVALLAWAFRASQIAARREEHVTLTPSRLDIARRPGTSHIVLNPYWVRVELLEPDMRLTLWSHGKAVLLGTFLPPAERAGLAEALRSALWAARQRR